LRLQRWTAKPGEEKDAEKAKAQRLDLHIRLALADAHHAFKTGLCIQ
jgi:hypothetical protein